MATPQNLIDLLNNREAWPEDFVWNFRRSDTCAMGLARRTYGVRKSDKIIQEIEDLAQQKKKPNPFSFYCVTKSGNFKQTYKTDPSPKRIAKKIRELIEA